jgi:hypothetical protein
VRGALPSPPVLPYPCCPAAHSPARAGHVCVICIAPGSFQVHVSNALTAGQWCVWHQDNSFRCRPRRLMQRGVPLAWPSSWSVHSVQRQRPRSRLMPPVQPLLPRLRQSRQGTCTTCACCRQELIVGSRLCTARGFLGKLLVILDARGSASLLLLLNRHMSVPS